MSSAGSEFNLRVLAQAENKDSPLLERLKFLCIVSSNLDEFFEVRVAGLKEQMNLDIPGFGPDGMVPHQVFKLVSAQAHSLVAKQYKLLNQDILPASQAKVSVSCAAMPGTTFSVNGSKSFFSAS